MSVERWFDLSAPPQVSWRAALFWGVALPLPLLVYAAHAAWAEQIYLPGKRASGLHVEGTPALWLAAAYACLALGPHFHFCWGRSARLMFFRYPLVLCTLLAFPIALGGFAYTYFSR